MTVVADDHRHTIAGRSPLPAYLVSFVVLGLVLSLAGPALPHLRERAGVGVGASGLVLGAQSLGFIVGSLAAGAQYDRGRGHRLLVGTGVLAAAAIAALAGAAQLWSIMAVFAVIGFASATMDVGGNALVVWSQRGDRVGPSLNALHLCFGVGALATPLIVARSLAWTDGLVLVAVVVAVGVALCAVLLAGIVTPRRREAVEHHATAARSSAAFAVVCAFSFLYVGAEATFAGWVSTYADELGIGGVNGPGVLTSVFWVGFTLGRLVAISLVRVVATTALLVGSCVAGTVLVTVLALGDPNRAVVWVATALFGFALGPQFATMMAVSDERLRLSGSTTSLIVAAAGFGGLVLPVATGWVLDRTSATAMPWVVALASSATTAVAVAAVTMGRQRPPVTSMNAPVT